MIRRAADGDHPEAQEAMAELIERYWKPVYGYVRRRGHDPEDAKDVTQAFFTRMLETTGLAGADRERGRFRNYLLGALNHFMSNQAAAARAQKRGGGRPLMSLDFVAAETELTAEDGDSPEDAYNRVWAREVLATAMDTLQSELTADGKAAYFDVLALSLGADKLSYREIAEQLGLKPSDVTNYLHRARRRYREVLMRTVLPSVTDISCAEGEVNELLRLLSH